MEARVGVDGGSAARKFIQHQSRPQQPQISQIGTLPQLLAGGIAGAFSKTCTAPLARLTILFQVNYMFFAALTPCSFCFNAQFETRECEKKINQKSLVKKIDLLSENSRLYDCGLLLNCCELGLCAPET